MAVDPNSLGTLARETPATAIARAREVGVTAPRPGDGSTLQLLELLVSLAADDLGLARTVEPHLDALAILAQADEHALADDRSWGVFAAEGLPGPVRVSRAGRLSGTKPWCSLAGDLDAALVTATLDDGSRQLFAVDLSDPGVTVLPDTWRSRGLAEIPSGPVRFEDVAAIPVGGPGWYLQRPGFAWGGICVAACWHGGAVALARAVYDAASARPDDVLLAMHLGAIDEAISSSRRALDEAAALIDSGSAVGTAGSILAKRVRATVAHAGELVLERTGHALGPAPLALDEDHAKRAADLTVYLRQHHAERDMASLGKALVAEGGRPW